MVFLLLEDNHIINDEDDCSCRRRRGRLAAGGGPPVGVRLLLSYCWPLLPDRSRVRRRPSTPAWLLAGEARCCACQFASSRITLRLLVTSIAPVSSPDGVPSAREETHCDPPHSATLTLFRGGGGAAAAEAAAEEAAEEEGDGPVPSDSAEEEGAAAGEAPPFVEHSGLWRFQSCLWWSAQQ